MKEFENYIFFWGGFLSNFLNCEILYKNQIVYSSEQIFMAEKALHFKDIDSFNKIMLQKEPKKCKDLGKKIKGFSESEWDKVKFEIMINACHLKFSQNEDLKTKLLQTGNKILVEGSPYDKIWGVGIRFDDPLILDEKNWKGLNLLGKALTVVRTNLGYSEESIIKSSDNIH